MNFKKEEMNVSQTWPRFPQLEAKKERSKNTVMGKNEMTLIVILLMGLYVFIDLGNIFQSFLVSFIDPKLTNALLDSFLFHLNRCHWGIPLTRL